MVTTIIGWVFVVGGGVWVFGAYIASGLTEYRAGREELLSGAINGIPGWIAILIGAALIAR